VIARERLHELLDAAAAERDVSIVSGLVQAA
jgi:hypothetical protein